VLDSYYTPKELAERLIACINKKDISSVADFCVGEGDLLKAAQIRWGNAHFYGNDISIQVLHKLKKKYPTWILGNCDFLNQKSRNKSIIFKEKYDLIILNPPFTCRGAAIKSVMLDNKEYHVSTAMAYLVEAIKYLAINGVLYAILPQSIAYSEKDEKIRSYLVEKYCFRTIEELNNQSFKKCTPNIIIASINDASIICSNKSLKKFNINIKNIKIKRGNISMHKIEKSKRYTISLIHSTNIVNGKIVNLTHRVKRNNSMIEGPALLIHRVGQPNINKLCIISKHDVYALSDCIIGIKTSSMTSCKFLKDTIINNWDDFSNLYKGTGAKYLTIKRLKCFLNLAEEGGKNA
jgi:hypothetical protein